ncbi:MAG: hypothetical protein MZV65_28865, partial [Chromatiales bacterium]|nr:hypothetical protein [Chromatiales bacterium]
LRIAKVNTKTPTTFFSAAEQTGYQGVPHTRAEWVEKDHGRIETRRCVRHGRSRVAWRTGTTGRGSRHW